MSEQTVTYGDWEPDPDAAPLYAGTMDRGGSLVLRAQTGGWRRRVFITWYEGERQMGRWHYERRRA